MTRPLENWVKGFLNDKTSRELGQVTDSDVMLKKHLNGIIVVEKNPVSSVTGACAAVDQMYLPVKNKRESYGSLSFLVKHIRQANFIYS